MEMRQDPRTGLTRRRFLEAAAIVPLAFRGQAATTQPDILELGARDAVERIKRGELKAEDYVAELLKQYNAHKNLNLVTSIDQARVLEAARSVDQSRARGAQLGPAVGLPFAVCADRIFGKVQLCAHVHLVQHRGAVAWMRAHITTCWRGIIRSECSARI